MLQCLEIGCKRLKKDLLGLVSSHLPFKVRLWLCLDVGANLRYPQCPLNKAWVDLMSFGSAVAVLPELPGCLVLPSSGTAALPFLCPHCQHCSCCQGYPLSAPHGHLMALVTAEVHLPWGQSWT